MPKATKGSTTTKAKLQAALDDRNAAFEAQQLRIDELIAQVATIKAQAGGATSTANGSASANTAGTNVENNDDDEDLDLEVGPGVGLVPHPGVVPPVVAPAAVATATATNALAPAPIPTPAVAPAAIVPVAVPAPNPVPQPAPANPAAQAPAANVKIPHPGGEVNHGIRLRQAMQLDNNIRLYHAISRKTRWAVAFGNLPLEIRWDKQDPQKVAAIASVVVNSYNYLQRFEPPSWPVLEMMKTYLRNRRYYKRKITLNGVDDSDGGFDPVPAA
ncbi:hypothetical protein FS749_005699 [Ceratobasidium sp. UAMH 11750]|nr:hypothetical protein FS749_005699 [Ceratobasidium sp. UAMH 11750]